MSFLVTEELKELAQAALSSKELLTLDPQWVLDLIELAEEQEEEIRELQQEVRALEHENADLADALEGIDELDLN